MSDDVEIKPCRGYFAAVGENGNIITQSISYRAKTARMSAGEWAHGVGSWADGWDYLFRFGYRIRKVDVMQHFPGSRRER